VRPATTRSSTAIPSAATRPSDTIGELIPAYSRTCKGWEVAGLSRGADGTRSLITARTLADTRGQGWLKSYRCVRALTALPDSRCHARTRSRMAVPILAPVEDVAAPERDAIARALAVALAVWCDERDARSLRRALLAVLTKLDEAP
jgi:hypothetical protein